MLSTLFKKSVQGLSKGTDTSKPKMGADDIFKKYVLEHYIPNYFTSINHALSMSDLVNTLSTAYLSQFLMKLLETYHPSFSITTNCKLQELLLFRFAVLFLQTPNIDSITLFKIEMLKLNFVPTEINKMIDSMYGRENSIFALLLKDIQLINSSENYDIESLKIYAILNMNKQHIQSLNKNKHNKKLEEITAEEIIIKFLSPELAYYEKLKEYLLKKAVINDIKNSKNIYEEIIKHIIFWIKTYVDNLESCFHTIKEPLDQKSLVEFIEKFPLHFSNKKITDEFVLNQYRNHYVYVRMLLGGTQSELDIVEQNQKALAKNKITTKEQLRNHYLDEKLVNNYKFRPASLLFEGLPMLFCNSTMTNGDIVHPFGVILDPEKVKDCFIYKSDVMSCDFVSAKKKELFTRPSRRKDLKNSDALFAKLKEINARRKGQITTFNGECYLGDNQVHYSEALIDYDLDAIIGIIIQHPDNIQDALLLKAAVLERHNKVINFYSYHKIAGLEKLFPKDILQMLQLGEPLETVPPRLTMTIDNLKKLGISYHTQEQEDLYKKLNDYIESWNLNKTLTLTSSLSETNSANNLPIVLQFIIRDEKEHITGKAYFINNFPIIEVNGKKYLDDNLYENNDYFINKDFIIIPLFKQIATLYQSQLLKKLYTAFEYILDYLECICMVSLKISDRENIKRFTLTLIPAISQDEKQIINDIFDAIGYKGNYKLIIDNKDIKEIYLSIDEMHPVLTKLNEYISNHYPMDPVVKMRCFYKRKNNLIVNPRHKSYNINSSNISEHAEWIYQNIYFKPNYSMEEDKDSDQPSSIMQYAFKIAIYIPIIVNLMRKEKIPNALGLSDTEILICQIAALFIHAGTEISANHNWAQDSGIMLYYYLTAACHCDQNTAILLAEALVNSNIPTYDDTKKNYKLNIDDNNVLSWSETSVISNNIYITLLKDARNIEKLAEASYINTINAYLSKNLVHEVSIFTKSTKHEPDRLSLYETLINYIDKSYPILFTNCKLLRSDTPKTLSISSNLTIFTLQKACSPKRYSELKIEEAKRTDCTEDNRYKKLKPNPK